MNDTFSSKTMLYISLAIFVIFLIYFSTISSDSTQLNWFIRVVVSLAAGAMSMSLSGSINIGKDKEMRTLAEESPKITAAGALAVFVLVYLFDPIKFTV
ncbi:hypothetical protein [uncultured Winogradskyella sp.]|uniref:hypothetical protein n=1 Tax=uncultured Winogradskyella sp. TaxID=395353 RepID=UPI00260F9A67|nr:hypothetical protein [uncultured Winogradskyella sp.]